MFVADGGNWVAIAAKVIQLRQAGRWLDPGPLGCLGVGAPFAIAAKSLYPERPVFVIQGDGSFGLNGMDFDTALRFKLPMVCVVGNDAAWGQIRLPQVQFFGVDKSPATLLKAAARLGVPIVASEQYPKGLGPTIQSLRQLVSEAPIEKLEFSCGASKEIARRIFKEGRRQIIVAGMEAHVCVFQTVRDLELG